MKLPVMPHEPLIVERFFINQQQYVRTEAYNELRTAALAYLGAAHTLRDALVQYVNIEVLGDSQPMSAPFYPTKAWHALEAVGHDLPPLPQGEPV